MSSHIANENYFLLNRELSEKFFDDIYKVRYYQNASMALYDIATCLQQFLAHKAYFAVAKNGSSLIESLSPIWIRNVNPLQIKDEAQHWVEFIESLHAETNFVIWASENEITGEVLVEPSLAQEIHQRLSHKRIYSIQICHHADKAEKIFPYSIKILRPNVFSDGGALVLHTERYKAQTQIGAFQIIDCDRKKMEDFFETSDLNLSGEIQKFEAQIMHPKNVYFNRFVPTTLRLNDRLVLNYSRVNAYAIQQELNLADAICFAPSQYPVWVLNLWKSWWKETENEILIRGLLVISIHALRQDLSLITKINQCVDEFQRLGQPAHIV